MVKLEVLEVGEHFRFEADKLLDAAKEYAFSRMAIIGELEDGTPYLAGTANFGETLILMEKTKHHILFGDHE